MKSSKMSRINNNNKMNKEMKNNRNSKKEVNGKLLKNRKKQSSCLWLTSHIVMLKNVQGKNLKDLNYSLL